MLSPRLAEFDDGVKIHLLSKVRLLPSLGGERAYGSSNLAECPVSSRSSYREFLSPADSVPGESFQPQRAVGSIAKAETG